MRPSRFVRPGLFLLLCAGCAMGQVPAEKSGSNPTTEAVVAPPETGLTRIFFYRNPFAGIGVQPDITLNGQSIGASPLNGEYYFVERTPGKYEVELAKYLPISPKTTLTLDAGKTAYVRISWQFFPFVGSWLSPEVVDPATGAKEIQALTRSGVTTQ